MKRRSERCSPSHEPLIRENPSQKDDLALAAFLGWVVEHRCLTVLLSRLVGANGRETRKMLKDPELMGQVKRNLPVIRERVGLPDRFNALLGPLGWAAFEEMDPDIAKEAVLLAERGDLEGAEAALVRHFGAHTVARDIDRLCGQLGAFEARRSLLLKSVEDHREGRFHASVPLALIQLDGIAHDLAGKGFFVSPKNAAHLLARDSVAGHPSGLAALSGAMSRGRRRTSASEIGVPYRHGILHGRDLGYANETVSAKAFAAVLALGSWAAKVERGEQHLETPRRFFDPDNIGFADLGRELKGAVRAILRAWFSRSGR